MNPLMTGAIAMGFALAGVYFLRFWFKTRDRLFGLFALSFFVLALNRVALGLRDDLPGVAPYLYWIRFAAFAVLLTAIIDKNRTGPTNARVSLRFEDGASK